jgi:APA family basic amino acid/polyamine antiporter
LLDTVVFADWIFFALTVAGLFILRRKTATPAFLTPLYPWLPLAFVGVALAVVASTILKAPVRSGVGALLLLAGVPVFYYFVRRSGKK